VARVLDSINYDHTACVDFGPFVVRVFDEPDYSTSVDDFPDMYGKIAPGDLHDGYGNRRRPDDFDGNAERIWHGNDGPWWWQPPSDVKRSDRDAFAALRESVKEVCAFGFVGIVVEISTGTDAYGRRVPCKVASLWGIEAMRDESYTREVVADLLAEAGV
jgi:hypothetical protein